ncbi:MAG: hypothetical protein IJ727_03725 [Treponema sp.]|nr:hypothetical protein [Treponema sp.]
MKKPVFVELPETLVKKFDDMGYVITFPKDKNTGDRIIGSILDSVPVEDVEFLSFAKGYEKLKKEGRAFLAYNCTDSEEIENWTKSNLIAQGLPSSTPKTPTNELNSLNSISQSEVDRLIGGL